MGTPDFLSPEQARSSIGLGYPLGICIRWAAPLYYLLTGKPPFGGTGPYAKMIAHFKEPPPKLGDSRTDVPAELEGIFQKLMAKSPDERYQTPNEVAAALRSFTDEDEEHVTPGRSQPHEDWLAE